MYFWNFLSNNDKEKQKDMKIKKNDSIPNIDDISIVIDEATLLIDETAEIISYSGTEEERTALDNERENIKINININKHNNSREDMLKMTRK